MKSRSIRLGFNPCNTMLLATAMCVLGTSCGQDQTNGVTGEPSAQIYSALGGPRWVAVSRGGAWPGDAFVGGFARGAGENYYVCRGSYAGGQHPGAALRSSGLCSFGYGGDEILVSNYEVLAGVTSYRWEGASKAPSYGFVGGFEPGVRDLAVCRYYSYYELTPGKVFANSGTACLYGESGKEVLGRPWEILIISGSGGGGPFPSYTSICGSLGCPAGYHAERYQCDYKCGARCDIGPAAGLGPYIYNSAVCASNWGFPLGFYVCGLSCPAGTSVVNHFCEPACGNCPPIFGPNSTLCR